MPFLESLLIAAVPSLLGAAGSALAPGPKTPTGTNPQGTTGSGALPFTMPNLQATQPQLPAMYANMAKSMAGGQPSMNAPQQKQQGMDIGQLLSALYKQQGGMP